jgi:hypothetical protein
MDCGVGGVRRACATERGKVNNEALHNKEGTKGCYLQKVEPIA